MSTAEIPSQIEQSGTALGRSICLEDEPLERDSYIVDEGISGAAARLMLWGCEYGSLIEGGTLDMRLPDPQSRGYTELIIAGGFKTIASRRDAWTWDLSVRTAEESLHLVTDVDLVENAEGAQKFDIERRGDQHVAVPGDGQFSLPNLWQQVSPDYQGRLTRESFVYDENGLLLSFIKRTFERSVLPFVGKLEEKRMEAEELAASSIPKPFTHKHIASNVVGFNGTTALTNVDLASGLSPQQRTRAERVTKLEGLPTALTSVLNTIFPAFDCPVAIIDSDPSQTRKLDIKDL